MTAITLPATTPVEKIDRTLEQMVREDAPYMIAVEVFDHPQARRVSDGARYGGDAGPTTLGAWLLGTPEEVHAALEKGGWEQYEEQYEAGHQEA